MLDDPRLLAALGMWGAGLGWWVGVECWRGRSREHSARMFWLHLTAPVVAIVLMAMAIGLVVTSERYRKARSRSPNPAPQQTAGSSALFVGLAGPSRGTIPGLDVRLGRYSSQQDPASST